jgi:hypothetical protein
VVCNSAAYKHLFPYKTKKYVTKRKGIREAEIRIYFKNAQR